MVHTGSTELELAVRGRIEAAAVVEQHISLAAVAEDELERIEAVVGRPERAGGTLAAAQIALLIALVAE
jgi:hypothetical protein